MARAAQIGLIIAGIINLLPLAGALGADNLRSLYGLASITPDLEILLRHRAILFGLVGSQLIAAAFVPGLQLAALLIGGVSMASFIVIALLVGTFGAPIRTIVLADVVGLLALSPAAFGLVANR